MNNASLFAGCVLIWGTTWFAITYQFGSVAPEISVSHRFFLAALIIAVVCRVRGLSLRFTCAEHLSLALFGFTMYCGSYILIYRAEQYLASGLVAIAYSASPLLSALGTRVFFRQPLSGRILVGSVAGITGITLVYLPEFAGLAGNHNAVFGALYVVIAVLISTVGGLLAQRNHQRKLAGWPTMAWSMGYGAAISLAVGLALGQTWRVDLSAPYLLSLAYLAVLGTVVTFSIWLTLVGRIGITQASYTGVMVPVVALFVSTVFEGFVWHPLTVAGVAVSIAGNVLVLGGRTRTG